MLNFLSAAILYQYWNNINNAVDFLLTTLFTSYHYFVTPSGDRDAYLIFKALNRSNSGMLSLSEFCNIYDICGYVWRPQKPPFPWFNGLPGPIRGCCYLIRRLVTWKWFDRFVCKLTLLYLHFHIIYYL